MRGGGAEHVGMGSLKGILSTYPCAPLLPPAEGKVVTMLMHHSRNTEQKQWKETLVLTLAGATKVRQRIRARVAGPAGG